MTTPDLFDAPARHRCRRCRDVVLRVHDDETGLCIELQPIAVPITEPLPTGRPVFENHPRIGWHCQSSPERRGYPIHLMHRCTTTTKTTNESETTA